VALLQHQLADRRPLLRRGVDAWRGRGGRVFLGGGASGLVCCTARPPQPRRGAAVARLAGGATPAGRVPQQLQGSRARPRTRRVVRARVQQEHAAGGRGLHVLHQPLKVEAARGGLVVAVGGLGGWAWGGERREPGGCLSSAADLPRLLLCPNELTDPRSPQPIVPPPSPPPHSHPPPPPRRPPPVARPRRARCCGGWTTSGPECTPRSGACSGAGTRPSGGSCQCPTATGGGGRRRRGG
jgi:hypothetical protein